MANSDEDTELSDRLFAHAKGLVNQGILPFPATTLELENIACADKVSISVLTEDGKIAMSACEAKGCFICKVSASIVTTQIKGLRVEEALSELKSFRDTFVRGAGEIQESELSLLLQFKNYPVRTKCVLLAFDVAERLLGEGGS